MCLEEPGVTGGSSSGRFDDFEVLVVAYPAFS